ncbi:Carboxylesterase, partial [Mycena pura]
GGYIYCNPANWPFDSWVHQSPNIVIVSAYYRLDMFGFLFTPEFVDPELGDFNVGFRDQTQALGWVCTHIGGDPGAVTINSESAGGSSVELHTTANVGRDLFKATIAQSAY